MSGLLGFDLSLVPCSIASPVKTRPTSFQKCGLCVIANDDWDAGMRALANVQPLYKQVSLSRFESVNIEKIPSFIRHLRGCCEDCCDEDEGIDVLLERKLHLRSILNDIGDVTNPEVSLFVITG